MEELWMGGVMDGRSYEWEELWVGGVREESWMGGVMDWMS